MNSRDEYRRLAAECMAFASNMETEKSRTMRTRIPKLRAWGLSLNGKRVRFLGFVEATNQEAAESTVVDELGLSHKQRKRLVVQELPGKVRAAAVSALNLNGEQ